MVVMRFLALLLVLALPLTVQRAQAQASDCLAMAQAPASLVPVQFSPAALTADQVQFTFLGHSTFLIESAGGVRIATTWLVRSRPYTSSEITDA